MQNRDSRNPTTVATRLGSIILILDGFSMLIFGFVYLIGAANADFFHDLEKKEAVLRQGEFVAILTLIYLISCVISIVYWQYGRYHWNYVVLVLGLIHLSVSYLVVSPDWEIERARLYFYGSLILDSLLVIFTIFRIRKLESFFEDRNT